MCLAIPARIESIKDSMAVAEIGGIRRSVSLRLTPEAGEGDYVLLHTGYVIGVIDPKEAEETLNVLRMMVDQGEGTD